MHMSHLKSFTPKLSNGPRIEKAPPGKVESFLVAAVSEDQGRGKRNRHFSQPPSKDESERGESDRSPNCTGAALGQNAPMHAATAFLARQMLHSLSRQTAALTREADASRDALADVARPRCDGI